MNIFGVIAVCFGGYLSIANWVIFFQNLKHPEKDPHPTPPLVGALFLGLGLLCFETTKHFAILSIIIDHGTLVLLISIPHIVKDFWSVSRFNLIRAYIGESQNAECKISLFKKDIFVIEVKFKIPQICNKHGARSVSFGLQGNWKEIDGVVDFAEHYGRKFKLIPCGDKYLLRDINYPEDKEYKYDCLDGIEFLLSMTKNLLK